jgi:galactose mutarotase-like enzyme
VQKEVDLHLLDHGSTECSLISPTGTVTLRGSAEYTHWVVWTLAGRDFVCLEPWTCPGNAINTGDRLLTLAPGATRTLWLEIIAG